MKVGFLGSGKLVQALAKGFIKNGVVKAENLIASSPKQDKLLLDEFQKLGGKITYNNEEVVNESNIVILAVKPNIVSEVLNNIKQNFNCNHLLISTAMGITIKQLETNLKDKSKVIRVMPNTAASVCSSASVICFGTYATSIDVNTTEKLFSAVGSCFHAPEYNFDAVTGLSGSGPAYILLVIEALSDGGVKMGLSRTLATNLAIQTVLGTATMALQSTDHIASLREAVTSPSGSTASGLHELEKGAIRFWFSKAVEAAAERSKTVSKQNN